MKTIIIDGVEYDLTPKALFKKGDWITNGKLLVGQVTSFDGEYYHYMQEGIEQPLHISNAYNWHLWTIKDVKDGDVLYSERGAGVESIHLVNSWKKVDGENTLCSVCTYRIEDDEIITGGLGAIWWHGVQDPFSPATKEQRDLLFSKMKEAGYEWDAEKKELKKIEQKPAWNEEDERILFKIQDHLREFYVDKKGYPYVAEPDSPEMMEMNWLNSIKDRIQP